MINAMLESQIQRARSARARFRAARRATELASKAIHAALQVRQQADGPVPSLSSTLSELNAAGGFVARCRSAAFRLELEAVRLSSGGAL